MWRGVVGLSLLPPHLIIPVVYLSLPRFPRTSKQHHQIQPPHDEVSDEEEADDDGDDEGDESQPAYIPPNSDDGKDDDGVIPEGTARASTRSGMNATLVQAANTSHELDIGNNAAGPSLEDDTGAPLGHGAGAEDEHGTPTREAGKVASNLSAKNVGGKHTHIFIFCFSSSSSFSNYARSPYFFNLLNNLIYRHFEST